MKRERAEGGVRGKGKTLKRRYNGRITYNLKSPANITEYEIMAKSIYGACDGALSDSTTFIEPWGKDITTFKVEFGNYNRDYRG